MDRVELFGEIKIHKLLRWSDYVNLYRDLYLVMLIDKPDHRPHILL